MYRGYTSDTAYIFKINRFWSLNATYSHIFLWIEEETICSHFTDNAIRCAGNFQMTAPKKKTKQIVTNSWTVACKTEKCKTEKCEQG